MSIDPNTVNSWYRQPVTYLLVWLHGDDEDPVEFTHLITAWSVNRTPEDSPEGASQFLGTIAAQATITLEWHGNSIPGGDNLTRSRDLSPYVAGEDEFREAAYGIGLKAQILAGFRVPEGDVEDPPEPIFTGRIEAIGMTDGAVVQLTCQDLSQSLTGTVDLPVCATTGGDLPIFSIAEFLLRKGGYYRSPPPLDGCILSVPGLLPEIGALGKPLDCSTLVSGYLNGVFSHTISDDEQTLIATDTYAPTSGTTTVIEGWWRLNGAAGTLLTLGSDQVYGGIRLAVNADESLTIQTLDATSSITTSAALFTPGAYVPKYVFVELQHSATSTAWFVQVGTATQSGTGPRFLPADNLSPTAVIGGRSDGVSIRLVPTAAYTRTVRNTWAATYDIDVRHTHDITGVVKAVPRGQTGPAWQLIRDMATAVGSWCAFDESGTFMWREYGERTAARVDYMWREPIDDSQKLIASGFSYNAASMRSEVTADWTDYEVVRSTVAEPLWSAAEPLIFPANTITTLYVDTDEPLASILPARKGTSTSTGYSSIRFVPEAQVGDPAASPIDELDVRIVPTAAGFAITVRNSRSVPVATWDPGTSAPFLQLQGWKLASPGTHAYTAKASTRTFEPLVLPSSTWRQTRTSAVELCDTIAPYVSLPQMVFAEQTIVSDPNLRIGQMTTLHCWAVMDEPIDCEIVGINYAEDEYGITVLPAFPPTGWILRTSPSSDWPENPRSILDTDITLSA